MTTDEQLPIGEEPAVLAPASLDNLIVDYAIARSRREQADDEAKELRATEVEAEARLFDALERLNLRSVKHEQYGQFRLNDLAWAAVTDPAAARAWAENEFPEILLLNASRLAVIVRQAARGERAMPPGVEARYSRKIGWTKS